MLANLISYIIKLQIQPERPCMSKWSMSNTGSGEAPSIQNFITLSSSKSNIVSAPFAIAYMYPTFFLPIINEICHDNL